MKLTSRDCGHSGRVNVLRNTAKFLETVKTVCVCVRKPTYRFTVFAVKERAELEGWMGSVFGVCIIYFIRIRRKLVVDRIAGCVFCHGDRVWVKGDCR